MKSNFPEFYRASEEEFQKIWDDCIFIFDANALLNLYRYSRDICDEFIKILTDQKIKDRVWIPHQFALEYQRNRLDVIAEQARSYNALLERIAKLITEFERHPFLNMKNVMQSAVQGIRSAAGKHPKWHEKDLIRDSLTDLFTDKVGSCFSQEQLKKIYDEGKLRYDKQVPPGYLDRKKGGEAQFGDLIGWKQILEYAKEIKKPIIFITSENDEDWWWKINGKTIGARHELVKEIKDFSSVFFCMYNWRLFHKQAAKYLKRRVDKKIEKEIRQIAQKINGDEGSETVSSENTEPNSGQESMSLADTGETSDSN